MHDNSVSEEGVIGSSVAPKMFNSASSLGLSGGDSVTQAQPVAQVANPGVPAFSAYSQQQANPAADPTTNPDAGGGGDVQDARANLRNRPRPFYGAYI